MQQEKKIKKIAIELYNFHKTELINLLKNLTYENVHSKRKMFKKFFNELNESEMKPYLEFAEKVVKCSN